MPEKRYTHEVDAEPKSTSAGRLLLAFEMADFGIALMRQNLKKRYPSETDAQTSARLATWLEGPAPTDTDLGVIPWPR